MSETKQETGHKTDPKVKALSARLCAVQGVYQMLHTGQSVQEVYKQHIEDAPDREIDGEKMVLPDGVLLKNILFGVHERKEELAEMLDSSMSKEGQPRQTSLDKLLQAIFLCGAYELLAHQETDSPIIINDYLNVTHAFYEKGEVSLVNGVLDSLAAALRI